jgi:hypothetical protein
MDFVDESGVYLLPGRGRTYAPCRQTPVLRWPPTRDPVLVMSGITMDGRISTLVRDETLDSLGRVIVLQHLWPHVADTLVVIWDGSPIPQGEVHTF